MNKFSATELFSLDAFDFSTVTKVMGTVGQPEETRADSNGSSEKVWSHCGFWLESITVSGLCTLIVAATSESRSLLA